MVGAANRRTALRLAAGVAVCALPAWLGKTAAATACAAHGKPCKADGACCSGFCERVGKCSRRGRLTGKCRCRCAEATTTCGAKACCGPGQECSGGQCLGDCVPDCADRVCGDDGCGGACGACDDGQECRDGQCVVPCVPNCIDRTCGDDGCGGSCGSCPAHQMCAGRYGSPREGQCCKVNGQICSYHNRDLCCTGYCDEIADKDGQPCYLPTISGRCCSWSRCSASCECCEDALCRNGYCCLPTGGYCGSDLDCCSRSCGRSGRPEVCD
jgi:hypothetical protein